MNFPQTSRFKINPRWVNMPLKLINQSYHIVCYNEEGRTDTD